MAKQPTQARVKRRERKNIISGVAHVNATFNNTMITITDAQGNAIAWSSAGAMGFKGSRKSTPYAAQVAAEDAGKKAAEHGMKTLEIEVSGPDAEAFLDYLLTNSAGAAAQGIGFYSPLCSEQGGTIDDLIAYKRSSKNFLLCVNASNTEKDFDHFLNFEWAEYIQQLIGVK